jgi:hypothetical protein
MSERDDGGPAFPTAWENDSDMNAQAPDGVVVPPMTTHYLRGMSLRDYFAGQAINAALAMKVDLPGDAAEIAKNAANACYRVADAMLKARQA